MLNELSIFIRKPIGNFPRNAWIRTHEHQEIYFRNGLIYLEGEKIHAITIANIKTDEDYQNKGIFKKVLEYVESFGKTVYIENVLNPILESFLERRGYTAMMVAIIKNK